MLEKALVPPDVSRPDPLNEPRLKVKADVPTPGVVVVIVRLLTTTFEPPVTVGVAAVAKLPVPAGGWSEGVTTGEGGGALVVTG